MACSKTALSGSINDFTFDIYKYIAAQNPDDNAFMSTTSIMVVMTMLHVGARNNTAKQMSKVLRLSDTDRGTLLSEVQKFVEVLKGSGESVELKTANKLFPNVNSVILEEYVKTVSERYKAEIKNMDYSTKAEESRAEINTWVEGETNGKITDLLPQGSVSPSTGMVVVNAIYFKGNWDEQFKSADTQNGDFYTNHNEKIQVKMMGKEFKKIKYTMDEQLACKALEIPYVGGNLGMVLLLPDDISGLADLEKQLSTARLQNLMSQMQIQKAFVILPKFKLEASYELKDTLAALGMVDIFGATADLSGIGNGLNVSQVFHKAFVNVNEEGTEAAAATAAAMGLTCSVVQTSFIADHPFLFMIWDHRLDVPLFIGRLTKPKI